jgi:hypothetical protein
MLHCNLAAHGLRARVFFPSLRRMQTLEQQ